MLYKSVVFTFFRAERFKSSVKITLKLKIMKTFKNYTIKKTFLEECENIVLVQGRVVVGYETNPNRIIKNMFNNIKMYDSVSGAYLGSVTLDENTTEIEEN